MYKCKKHEFVRMTPQFGRNDQGPSHQFFKKKGSSVVINGNKTFKRLSFPPSKKKLTHPLMQILVSIDLIRKDTSAAFQKTFLQQMR